MRPYHKAMEYSALAAGFNAPAKGELLGSLDDG
jgi:hypothetical protein